MEVIKLLESQNRCLNQFLKASETFLLEAQSGNLAGLELFQVQRDGILKALQLYDRKITEEASQLGSHQLTSPLKTSIQQALNHKKQIVEFIFKVDQAIIEEIEKEKKQLVQELSNSDKNHQLVMKFKSKWVTESGETLDGKI